MSVKEIFGLYGLVGAGRTELLETIFGIRTRAAGRVYLNHKLMNFSCAKEAMDYGFALITEERKANGLFLKGNLTFNTTIANLNAYKKGAALSEPKMTKATANEIKVMHTKCLGPNDMISSLSGGNQQKVIFGKWLEREPKVFMMDEPTRGIDVGAKYEIYDLIIQMAKQERPLSWFLLRCRKSLVLQTGSVSCRTDGLRALSIQRKRIRKNYFASARNIYRQGDRYGK